MFLILIGMLSFACDTLTCTKIESNVYCGSNCVKIDNAVYCGKEKGQSCVKLDANVYCGSNCSKIDGNFYCGDTGLAQPAAPARPYHGS